MRVFTAFELTLCRHRRLHRCFFLVVVHLPNHHCRIISRFISAFAVQLTCLGEREITSFANVVHFGVAWVFVCVNVWARALHKCGHQIWRRRCGQSQYQNDFIRIKWDNIQMFFLRVKTEFIQCKGGAQVHRRTIATFILPVLLWRISMDLSFEVLTSNWECYFTETTL